MQSLLQCSGSNCKAVTAAASTKKLVLIDVVVLTFACPHVHASGCWHIAWALLSMILMTILLNTAPGAAQVTVHSIIAVHCCGGSPAVQLLHGTQIVLSSRACHGSLTESALVIRL